MNNCGAWLMNEFSPVKGARRVCVLAPGHYNDPDTKGLPIEVEPEARSWHTDCPSSSGMERPPRAAFDHEHNGETCAVWSDRAEGAHASDTAPMSLTPVELPTYHVEIKFTSGDGETIVSASLYGPAEFLAVATGVIGDSFRDEVQR